MGFSSGVASQVGYKTESSWGSEATVDHFPDFTEYKMDIDPTWAVGEGMYSNGQYARLNRTTQTTRFASGTFGAEVASNKFGPLIRQMLGSSTATPTLITGTAYKQVHQNGSQDGLSTTFQGGFPEVSTGTVKPMTAVGTKVADWELSCAEGEYLQLALGLNAKDLRTLTTSPAAGALVAAAYVNATELFNFTQCVIKIGGTASTASSIVSIAGGTPIAAVVKGFSLKGTNDMNAEGYGTSATMSREQKSKRSTTILTLDTEFNTQSELYDVFRAGTVVPVQITFTGSQIAATGSFNTVDIVIAGTKIRKAPVSLNDEDLATTALELEVGFDGTNKEVQITLISNESTI